MLADRLLAVGEIRAVAVIGAGTMGRGIAQTAAVAGYDVVVADADQAALARGLASIHDTLAMLVEKGKIGAAERHAALARLTTSPSLAEGVSGADLVVEAVPESLELKSGIFRELDAAAPAGALLASNTSSLPIGKLAAATRRPDRVVGMHFFNPVPVMPLLEIVRADATSDETVGRAVECDALFDRV